MIGKRLRKIFGNWSYYFVYLCKICPNISKIHLNCDKQIILLIIPYEKKEECHYLALKKLTTWLRWVTSKHHGDFYYLNCLHSFRTENKLKSHEKVYKSIHFCRILMPSEKENILECKQDINSHKISYTTYADTEFLIKKIDECANNLENSSTTEIGEHIPRGYSMPTI